MNRASSRFRSEVRRGRRRPMVRPARPVRPFSPSLRTRPVHLGGAWGPPPEPEPFEPVPAACAGFPASLLKALRHGREKTAIRLAAAFGFRDETPLTHLVFQARHPERCGRPLQSSEPGFARLRQEWLDIRDRLVRPILARLEP